MVKEKETKIGKGIRQGCILSPMLFNLYTKEAIKKMRTEIQKGVWIGGKTVTCPKISGGHSALHGKKRRSTKYSNINWQNTKNKYGMQLNKKKTKVMVCCNTNLVHFNLNIDNEQIK